MDVSENELTQEDTKQSASPPNLDVTVEINEAANDNLDDTLLWLVPDACSEIPPTPQPNPTRVSCASGSTPASPSTPHTYPNWLGDLKKGFRSLVIDKCSYRTRQAVDNNEDIKVKKSSLQC